MESNSADSSESSNKSEKESGIVGASFNIINAILGSGIIGIPAAIREAGFSMGVVLLVLVGMVTEYTLYILVSTGVSVGCFSYQEVMRRAFGRSGYILATVVQFAAAFSGESHKSIAFLVLDMHSAPFVELSSLSFYPQTQAPSLPPSLQQRCPILL